MLDRILLLLIYNASFFSSSYFSNIARKNLHFNFLLIVKIASRFNGMKIVCKMLVYLPNLVKKIVCLTNRCSKLKKAIAFFCLLFEDECKFFCKWCQNIVNFAKKVSFDGYNKKKRFMTKCIEYFICKIFFSKIIGIKITSI